MFQPKENLAVQASKDTLIGIVQWTMAAQSLGKPQSRDGDSHVTTVFQSKTKKCSLKYISGKNFCFRPKDSKNWRTKMGSTTSTHPNSYNGFLRLCLFHFWSYPAPPNDFQQQPTDVVVRADSAVNPAWQCVPIQLPFAPPPSIMWQVKRVDGGILDIDKPSADAEEETKYTILHTGSYVSTLIFDAWNSTDFNVSVRCVVHLAETSRVRTFSNWARLLNTGGMAFYFQL